jgi:hypothetical protein
MRRFRRSNIHPLRRTLPAAISTPTPSEEPSDQEPSDFDGEGHPAPTNLPSSEASDSEDDQRTAMTDPLARTSTSVGRRDYASPYESPSISSATSSSPCLQTPLNPVIRLVSTTQKPSSSRRRDIVSTEGLGGVDSKKGIRVYNNAENVSKDKYLPDAVGGSLDEYLPDALGGPRRLLSDATGGPRRPLSEATGGPRRLLSEATGGAAGAGFISETPESGTSASSSRVILDSRASGQNASRVVRVTQDSEPVRSLAVTPNTTTMDLINNLITMGIAGASLRETNSKFRDVVETLRLENPSAAAFLDEAMKTGGKVRVEVDDRYATSTKTPGASKPTSLSVSAPKSPREPAPKSSSEPSSRSSNQKSSKKTKSKARAPSPEPSDGEPSDSTQDTPPPRQDRRAPSDAKRPRAPAPEPPGDSSSEEDDLKPPRPSKTKPKPKDTRKSYGEAAFLYEEDISEPDDPNMDQDQDFSNSTIDPTEVPKPSQLLRTDKTRTPSRTWSSSSF